MLHNPDQTGYTSEAVWQALQAAKDAGLTDMLGIAPGPANGFTLDLKMIDSGLHYPTPLQAEVIPFASRRSA